MAMEYSLDSSQNTGAYALVFMIRDLTISNRNVKHLESSDAAVSQFLIRYLAVWPGP